VAPRDYALSGGSDPWEMQSECVLAASASSTIDVRVRAVQFGMPVPDRFGGNPFAPIERIDGANDAFPIPPGGVEREIDATGIPLASLFQWGRRLLWTLPGGRERGAGRKRRPAQDLCEIEAMVLIDATPDEGWIRLRVRIENHTEWPALAEPRRDRALPRSLIGTHALVTVREGAFVSPISPPRDAESAALRCLNLHSWPVLAGPLGQRDLVLSSPIPLGDHPAITIDRTASVFGGLDAD
jgi:hypothetical protein